MTSIACGPAGRSGTGDDGTSHVDASQTCSPEVCNDGIDNDCDGLFDCHDPDCSGIDGCPICGAVEHPLGSPLALPDGIGQSTVCSTDAQCTTALLPNCVAKECHASYVSTLKFIGFGATAKLDDPAKLLSVCATMEHTWIRDLQIELITPDDTVFVLEKFVGRTGDEIYLGQANDSDPADMPMPGTGWKYCWTAAAPYPMLNAPTTTWQTHDVLPAGDYKTASPWSALQGATLNGEWKLRVTDLWPADNGFIFDWSIAFDPSLVADCSGPIIE